MGKQGILITGKLPPPIGGVTIHVSRLVEQLQKVDLDSRFINLNIKFLFWFIFSANRYRGVHIHASSPFIRFYLVLICFLSNTNSMVTIHGNIGRFSGRLKNWLDKLTIKYATKPIVLNTDSLEKARKWNSKAELISAFIPPIITNEFLSELDEKVIVDLRSRCTLLFCTNASHLSFDKNGSEIYGIFELIELFSSRPDLGLVISDPVGAYKEELQMRSIVIPRNVTLVSGEHSFFRIIDLAHATVRNTSTDGDSLSIKESLYLHKLTFATAVVRRPEGCIVYERGNFGSILDSIKDIDDARLEDIDHLDGFDRLYQLYIEYNKK